MTELKPCPFCGGEAKIKVSIETTVRSEPMWYARAMCTNPNCCADITRYSTDISFTTKNDMEIMVSDAWNRRVNNG